MISVSYTDDRDRQYFKDKSFEADYKFLEIEIAGPRGDDRVDDGGRPDVPGGGAWRYGGARRKSYLFDRKARTLVLQYKVREKLSQRGARSDEGGAL